MMEELDCVGLLVDAKRDAVAFYQRYGFMTLEVVEEAAAQRPQPTPMFLAVGSVPPGK